MYSKEGHRKRLRERFREEGLDSFNEVNVLELLLFYAKPRTDTKELARELLNRFGSLSRVLEATQTELETVEGVGECTSTLLALITQLSRYYLVNRSENPKILNTTEKYGRFLVHNFHGRRDESVFLLCLDAKCKMLACQLVGQGSVSSANVPLRKIVELALGANATTVVLAHNHPSGIALPSEEDKEATERLAVALSAMDIFLADHVIVSDKDFVSLAQSGMFDPKRYCLLR
jgi:DNA repair protein RadC